MLTTICFDADDTLWHNERFFQLTQERFHDLLKDHADRDHLAERLLDAERRNIGHYGFGIKGFMLSMIETALDVTENRVPGEVVAELIQAGQDMLRHPIELLPGAEETVRKLAPDFTLLLITKTTAFVFLGAMMLFEPGVWIVPVSAVGDGLMGLVVWLVHRRQG